jgi:4-amino-4-deoxy-L-arabinose transferase-like glycosyltransferase
VELCRVRHAGLAPTLSLALNQQRIAYAALAVLTLVRLTVAAGVTLAPDEAYYWVFSHALAPGYLDHPPMVALWIRAGTLIAGQTELGVRLLGPLSVALGSVVLMDAADRLLPGRNAGIAAAALLNATLLLGVGAVIMTPDTPLLFFWVATLWATARLLHSGRGEWWLAIGAFAGLALASKYTAAFLWIGIGLWLCWVPSLRRWWASAWLWAGTALGGLMFLPVVLWNAAHHWASFLRQGGRVADWHPARAAQFLGELIGGQFGLATPLLFVLFCVGVALAARRAWRSRDPASSLLAALTLPAVAVFVQHAFGDRVQGNWPAILYPAAAIAAAGLDPPRWGRWQAPAVATGLAFTAIVYVQAVTFVLPLPVRLDPIVHQLGGWDTLARDVAAASQRNDAAFVAAGQYGVASELAWALPADLPVVDDDPRWTFTTLPRVVLAGRSGILVQRARDRGPSGWANARPLNQVMAGRFRLWRVTAADTKATQLPGRR